MMGEPLRDRFMGVLFGHAIGDALGFAAEGLTKGEVQSAYPEMLRDFSQVRASGLAALRRQGMWTDDTSQMLCILESLVEKRRLDTCDVARKLYRWLVDDGFGVGALVYAVLNSPDYLINPEAVARRVWEESGRRRAPNGAVMRTSVLGIWNHDDLDAVARNAAAACRLTHADPRCVASTVAVSVAIAALLSGEEVLERVIALAGAKAGAAEPGAKDVIELGGEGTLEELDLDHGLSFGEENRVGYTYVTLSAGFWALWHADTFEDGLVAIINEGGDADTNAAVAGALLGARFGLQAIPQRWIEGLAESRYLASEGEDLLGAMAKSAQARVDRGSS